MCRVLNISRSSYYNWIKAGRPTTNAKDSVLLAHIRQVERKNDHNYGVRKVYDELKDKNIQVGRSKVQRVMHNNGIRAQIKSKYKPQTTKSNPDDAVFENLLQQDFSATEFNKWFSYYIIRRRHSALGGISPLAYEIRRNHPFVLSA